jgi:H-NS histone family
MTVAEVLNIKKRELEERLRQLQLVGDQFTPSRRPYPPVKAKFRNPDQPSETWSGRGKRPRWLDAKLRSGEQITLRVRITCALSQSEQLAKLSEFQHLMGKLGNAFSQLPLEIETPRL